MKFELETVKVDERLLAKPGRTRTAIYDPELKRLRAQLMMQARVSGYTLKEVAEMFKVSEDTVVRTLTYAKRAGILVEAADAILERMVPLGQEAILAALKASDDEVDKLSKANLAVKIFEGTGLLGNKGKPQGGHGGDSDLEKAMHQLREKAELHANTLEGQLVADRLQIPATAENAGADAPDAVETAAPYVEPPASAGDIAADRDALDREATEASAASYESTDDFRRTAPSKLS